MKKVIIVILFSLCILFAINYGSEVVKPDKPMILGYTLGSSNSDKSLTSFNEHFNTIATDTFSFDENGNLIGEAPKEQLSYAEKKKISTYAVISNFGEQDFNADLAHQMMTNKLVKNRFIKQVAKVAEDNGYTGVNIDLEAVYPEDRIKLSSLIKDISAVLHSKQLKLMVSVPAKTNDDKDNAWTWPYDYKKIGSYADYIQVMTYDEHGSWGNPGSLVSMKWLENTLSYSTNNIKAGKVIMGIPAYGYDWNLTDANRNRMVQWDEIQELIKSNKIKKNYNKKTDSVMFNYLDKNKQEHIVWYENETTIEKKTKLVKKYKLGGVSVYALGNETESFWGAIQNGVK
ncbi:glycosyl hydrolase family 18 protein [Niallia taxi]|uniref:glycosyl hydrolase family 18 protein n=1 Tax=Niallia taxi TaxID=2499688 RepID=UPI002E22C79E|nr:glycosyl hydrolase family 18 protein [Niallia taxi]MED4036455.1 glycosyl hydrolase family 18 protein [Niallia taxi]